jgi:hypothetical protein
MRTSTKQRPERPKPVASNPHEPITLERMHRHAATRADAQCPFIDRDDPRCNSRFGLARLEQAFSVCFGSFRGCPMYHRLHAPAPGSAGNAESGNASDDAANRIPVPRTAATLVPVNVTRHGQPIELRATGS